MFELLTDAHALWRAWVHCCLAPAVPCLAGSGLTRTGEWAVFARQRGAVFARLLRMRARMMVMVMVACLNRFEELKPQAKPPS